MTWLTEDQEVEAFASTTSGLDSSSWGRDHLSPQGVQQEAELWWSDEWPFEEWVAYWTRGLRATSRQRFSHSFVDEMDSEANQVTCARHLI